MTGDFIFDAISDNGGGFYSSSINSCIPTTDVITCKWDDSLPGTTTVVFH